jgi:uroporphyrinogen-III synthase
VRPLTDKRILITRARHQASELAAQLEALGATTILIPTIEIAPPETYVPLDDALAHLDTFDWLLFTSANAVEVFRQRRAVITPSTNPKNRHPGIAVIGPATASAVQAIGLTVDIIPPQYVAESLAESLVPHAPNANMLLIRAAQARDILPERLTAAGARLTIVEAYRNRTPPDSILALQTLFASSATGPDAITFTSASTARNLLDLLEAANLSLPSGIILASIGPITSQILRDLGHAPTIEAPNPTIPALVDCILAHFKSA